MQAGKFEHRDPASREAGTLLSLIPLFISNYIKKFLQTDLRKRQQLFISNYIKKFLHTDLRKRQQISLYEKGCLFAIMNLFI